MEGKAEHVSMEDGPCLHGRRTADGEGGYETSVDGRTGWGDQGYEGGRLDRPQGITWAF